MEKSESDNIRKRLLDLSEDLGLRLKRYKSDSDYLSRLNIKVGHDILRNNILSEMILGERVLFCTGSGAMRRLGFYNRYRELFEKYYVEIFDYSEIHANPTLEDIERGVEIARKGKVNFVFALGGGSVIDSAKAVSCGFYADGKRVLDFIEKKAKIKNALPIVANSTTSGTGSHVTPYAVITNSETCEKKTLKNYLLLPILSIVDLDIVRHAPSEVRAAAGFDVLCHAVEVYTRNECTKAAEDFALRAIDLVRENLEQSVRNGFEATEAKAGMIYADINAGIALTLIGTHVPHAISHPISARYPQISHGQALAFIMPETIRRMEQKADDNLKEKFEKISELLGKNGRCSDVIEELVNSIDLNRKTNIDPELISSDTVRYRWASVKRDPTSTFNEQDIKDIVHSCF